MIARRLRLGRLVSLCVVPATLLLFVAPALAARGHVFGGTFGEPCISTPCGQGQLDEPSGVAVDEATGNVYVVDRGDDRVEYFSSAGIYIGEFNGSGMLINEGVAAGSGGAPGEEPTGRFENPEGIAIDNDPTSPSYGDVYVVDTGHSVIDKFGPEGEYLHQLTEISPGVPLEELDGVAVDPRGELWIDEHIQKIANYSDELSNEYLASRVMSTHPDQGVAFGAPGFAVDSKDNLYLDYEVYFNEAQHRVAEFESNGELLRAAVDTEQSTAVAVEQSSGDVYVDNVGTVARFAPDGALLERFGEGHLTEGNGVGVNGASETVYVADAKADVVDIYPHEEPGKPSVAAESASAVTGDSATLSGAINPHGAATEYHFEYGPTTTYGTSLPISGIGFSLDFEPSEVSVHLQDLLAGTLYHFRLVAHNEFGIFLGADDTFTTQAAGGALVSPDRRQWEMISPPDKHGALIEPIGTAHVTEASANGDAMTYVANAPTESEPQGYANVVQVLSTRAPGGWESRDIAGAHASPAGLAFGELFSFSEDLSLGVAQPAGGFTPSLSSEASEQTAYLRTNYVNGDIGEACPTSLQREAQTTCYRPLVTGKPGYQNVPSGTVFGEEGKCPEKGIECGPQFVGGTSNLGHIVLQSSVALTSTPLEPEGPSFPNGLYEWAGGKLALISVLPDGKVPNSSALGAENAVIRNAISDDGSRIVWTGGGLEPHLYMRDTENDETVQLDAVQGGSGGGQDNPQFQVASNDGSRVFFTDEQRLTPNSGAVANGRDLYECEITETAGKLECKLSDLTPPNEKGEEASLGTEVVGASEDGSWVYFGAGEVLAEGAVPGTCSFVEPSGTCNLYVRHDAKTKLVAVASNADYPDWGGGNAVPMLSDVTTRVSPDGRWLAFMSQRGLTGYDTRDAVSGQPDEEVYLYDAESEKLVCASCNPSGARPIGVAGGMLTVGLNGDRPWNEGEGSARGAGVAASLPGWTSSGSRASVYQSRYLSDGGRLFFNSNDSLVPQDVNGTGDVYEYEPPGVGDCNNSSVLFSERSGGCVGLISSGQSGEESGFLDASEDGGDVFFFTAAKLSAQDYDSSRDVYDAHECTAASPCFPASPVQPPPCGNGDSCKPAPTPQPSIFGSSASATFSGTGNLTAGATKAAVKPKSLTPAQKRANALRACRKKSRRKRAACERQARRVYRTTGRTNQSRKGGK